MSTGKKTSSLEHEILKFIVEQQDALWRGDAIVVGNCLNLLEECARKINRQRYHLNQLESFRFIVQSNFPPVHQFATDTIRIENKLKGIPVAIEVQEESPKEEFF